MISLKVVSKTVQPGSRWLMGQRRATARTVCRRPVLRAGYTLLEVVLALALSVLLLSGITVAINYHMTTLRQQQEEIERAQIARQSLFLITKDLRAAIQYKPIETDALNELKESVAAATDIGAIAEGAGVDEESLNEAGVNTEGTTEPEPSDMESTRPGLYGTANQLQIDISRLPRKDQYNLINFSDGTQSDIPSDVKTITYFVRNEDNYESNESSSKVDINETMGLVRRSLDRAVTRYALDNGGQVNFEDYDEILAQEITEIEFRYWDQENGQWETEWDSDEMMGLPGAIEITIALGTKTSDDENAEDDRKIYRSVVFLPLAEIIPPELENPDESDSSSGSETESSEEGSGGNSQ